MERLNWPKGWRRVEGRNGIFYRVPKHVQHLWDNKQTVKLGDSEVEAYKTWFAKTGGVDDLQRLTVESMLDTFMAEYVAMYLAESTFDSYKYHLLPLKKVFGHLHPRVIEPHMVYRYMDDRPRVAGNREASVLSSALTFAVEKGWIKTNLLYKNIRRRGARKENPRKRLPTYGELQSFTTGTYTSYHRPDLKSPSSEELPICPDWLKGYVALKMITGLRQGQMLAINLTEHWDNDKGQLYPPTSKGGADTRYHGEGLRVVIKSILGDRLPRGTLFTNTHGRAITASGFRSSWRRAMERYVAAGFEKFNEHDIRKYVASEAESLEHAQKLLGHQSPKVTAQVYRVAAEDVEVLK